MSNFPGPVKRLHRLMPLAFCSSLSLSTLFSLSPALAQYAAGQPAPNNVSGNQQAVGMYNLGLTAYKQGSLESAVIFFRHATDLDPNLTDAQYNLGVLYQSERRLKEAIPRFQEVLRVKPADPDAHYQLGLCLMDLGRPAEAKAQFGAVPPNSNHFAESQKKTQLCDSQLAGATVAQPSYSPTGQPAQTQSSSMNMNPIGSGDSAAPNQYTSQAAQIPVQPALGQPAYIASTSPPNVFVQTTNAQTSQAPVAARKSGGTPTAVLANSSVRVIATGFNAPAGLAFDRLGNLYVANFLSNSLDRISADGTRMQFSGGSNIKGPIGLVCDESGNVYVANYNGGTVARISPAGISTIIGTGFRQPYYLTLDRDGNLFVSQQEDNTIVRITLPKTVVTKP